MLAAFTAGEPMPAPSRNTASTPAACSPQAPALQNPYCGFFVTWLPSRNQAWIGCTECPQPAATAVMPAALAIFTWNQRPPKKVREKTLKELLATCSAWAGSRHVAVRLWAPSTLGGAPLATGRRLPTLPRVSRRNASASGKLWSQES